MEVTTESITTVKMKTIQAEHVRIILQRLCDDDNPLSLDSDLERTARNLLSMLGPA